MEEYDDYGRKDSYQHRQTLNADMQPASPNSTQKEFGKILQDIYHIYTPPSIEINDTDIIKVGENTYEIIGTPENWNHILYHKKITVKKHHKPVIL
ncbi:MAG: hypothetical protein Q4P18_07215 [Methanobrevibacter sp.]|uniref:hypothetical protein n=1 Tax=Methanobrevibacter sp. TaxID=66852 RepID=UPI0026E0A00D|nr:hypothetical protein [Methanobrevibacter sp.]MDO5849307.1 hypothetical protein [Methanobrevibacter sp.]